MKTLALAASALALAAGGALAQDKVSLTVNATQIFGTVDPAKINDYTEYMAAVNLYDGLTTVSPTGEVIPQLAESWTVSDDSRTYTFTLKAGATFQNGSPVEASDVVYALRRLLAINEGPAHLFSGLVDPENVKAVDPRTVEITLNRVYAPFIAITPLILPIDEEAAKAAGGGDEWAEQALAETPMGAGPYAMESWDRGAEMILSRYEDYHGGFPSEGRPIDEVRFVITRDEATVRALAQRGELGFSSHYQANETYERIAALDDYKLLTAGTATGFYIKMNTQVAPTDDIHVRRAVAMAIDTQTIRDAIYPGEPLTGPLSSVFEDAVPADAQPPVFDLEAAAEELKKSKYYGDGPIDIVHTYVAGLAFEEEIALLFKASLDSIGFNVIIQPEPWNRITELAATVETTPATAQIFYGPTYPSPDSVFYVQYHSDSAGTWASMEWLMNEEVDALIDQSRETVDRDARNAIYQELHAKLVEMQSDVFLLTQGRRHVAHRCVEGYAWKPMQSWDFDFSGFHWACEG
jgi:peptide/nickel transport system substrate-binding protein